MNSEIKIHNLYLNNEEGKTMRLKGGRHSGFTLLELLVVVIIIGVLAAVAIPRFNRAVERSRASEAITMLNAIKTAEIRYYQEYNSYTGAANLVALADLTALPIGTNNSYYFGYVVAAPSPTTFTATATRKTVPANSKPPAYNVAYTITLTQDGTLTNNMP